MKMKICKSREGTGRQETGKWTTRTNTPEHMLSLPKATIATESQITAHFIWVFIKKKKKRLEIHILNSKLPTYNYLPLLFKYTMWPKWNFSISWIWPVSLESLLSVPAPLLTLIGLAATATSWGREKENVLCRLLNESWGPNIGLWSTFQKNLKKIPWCPFYKEGKRRECVKGKAVTKGETSCYNSGLNA